MLYYKYLNKIKKFQLLLKNNGLPLVNNSLYIIIVEIMLFVEICISIKIIY